MPGGLIVPDRSIARASPLQTLRLEAAQKLVQRDAHAYFAWQPKRHFSQRHPDVDPRARAPGATEPERHLSHSALECNAVAPAIPEVCDGKLRRSCPEAGHAAARAVRLREADRGATRTGGVIEVGDTKPAE